MAKSDSQPLRMDLPVASYERMLRLKDSTEASSSTEVIRNALKLYEMLVEEKEKGSIIYMRDAKGSVQRLVIL